jgi:hypothetical protein
LFAEPSSENETAILPINSDMDGRMHPAIIAEVVPSPSSPLSKYESPLKNLVNGMVLSFYT